MKKGKNTGRHIRDVLLWILFTGMGFFSFSQSQFNLLTQGSGSQSGRSVLELPTGDFFVYGYEFDSLGPSFSVYDSLGNLKSKKIFNKPDSIVYAPRINQIQFSSDGHIVTCGNIDDSLGNSIIYFLKLDLQGTPVLFKQYSFGYLDIVRMVREDFDGGYVFVTQSFAQPNAEPDIFLFKTNSLGDLLWQKTLTDPGKEWPLSISVSKEGGYFISGEKDGLVFALKVDSTGGKQWEKFFHPGGGGGASAIQTIDSGYVLAGAMEYPAQLYDKDIWITKINSNGDSVWGFRIQETYIDVIQAQPVENHDGSLAFVGFRKSGIPFLLKLNSAGDSIWRKDYTPKGGISADLFGLVAANDKGFLLTGSAIDTTTFSQNIWILKVDSLGCDTLGCYVPPIDTTDSIPSDSGYHGPFVLWPNPFDDVVSFAGPFELPLNLRVWSVDGRIVLQKRLETEPQGKIHLLQESSFWRPGVYVIEIEDGKGFHRIQKVLKLR